MHQVTAAVRQRVVRRVAEQLLGLPDGARTLRAAGIRFEKAPQKLGWGYGAELRDPEGYMLYLWDEKSMREKGG